MTAQLPQFYTITRHTSYKTEVPKWVLQDRQWLIIGQLKPGFSIRTIFDPLTEIRRYQVFDESGALLLADLLFREDVLRFFDLSAELTHPSPACNTAPNSAHEQ